MGNRIVFLALFLVCSSLAVSEQKITELYFSYKGKTSLIPLVQLNGALFDRDCVKDPVKCYATRAYNLTKRNFDKGKWGSSALAYCKAFHAEPVVLRDKLKKEFAYCLFSDASFVSAWDLYNKHWKTK